jgi:hypothetical protein
MRQVRNLAIGVFVLVAVCGCGSESPQEMILGKWYVYQPAGIVALHGTAEFRKDGTVITEMGGRTFESTYRFLDDNKTLELGMSVTGRKVTEKNRIAGLKKSEMVLIDPKGVRAEFTRTKPVEIRPPTSISILGID